MDSQPRRAHYFAKQSIVCYTLLISIMFCSAFASKVFLYDIHWKTLLKKHFQLVSDFISLPPSFCFTLRFCSYESTKDKLSLYHIWTLVRRFVGVFRKKFLPLHYNWKVTSRLLGYFTKILQKNCREFFSTTAYKKEVRYNSNFLLLFWLFCQIIFDTSVSRSIRNIDSKTVYL